MDIQAWIISNPKGSIVAISFLVTLFITIVRYYMTDREKMKDIRMRQKELRAEMKEHKNNPEKMMEINKQMLEDMPEQMKMSFKPMIVTMIPILIVFAWMRSTYALTSIAGSWLWWYIGSSIIFSIFLSKKMGLQ
jgi:uncharacterized membrane protein (DUF106 family)|tara:strand:+ start:60 stop:464 length:405 start_codon:yes stop_codon:yes gene_type:complete